MIKVNVNDVNKYNIIIIILIVMISGTIWEFLTGTF